MPSPVLLQSIVALLLFLTAVAGPAPVRAGELAVFVHDGDGRAMKHESLRLRAVSVEADHRTRHDLRYRGMWRSTGVDGRAVFEGLPPGRYTVEIRRTRHPDFVRPADNPLAPAPMVSLFEENERQRIDVELTRGVRVTATLDLPDDGFAGFQAIFRHRESGRVVTSSFPEDANFVERVLVPGIWEVEVEPRPGYLLVGLDRDRTALPGHVASLDLAHEPQTTFLTWTYSAPAELRGVVVEETGLEPVVTIAAELVEAGPWLDAALRRGGSIFERVSVPVDPFSNRYEMVLPDGSWRVRPAGDRLIASDPEAVDLILAPADSRRADFTIRLEKAAAAGTFEVAVRDPRHNGLDGAIVEVYAAGDLSSPVATGVAGYFGNAALPQLAPGSYRIVAGHERTLEGSIEWPDYDPDDRQRQRPTVILSPGATVRLQAADAAQQPIADVSLTLERRDPLPGLTLQDAEFAAAKTRITGKTDRSGRLALQGLYPGRYRVATRLEGQRGHRGLIVLASGGEPLKRELEITIDGEETIEITARMLPASALRATLVCSDPWPLPGSAAARAFAVRDGAEGAEGAEPVLDLADVILTGRGRDTLSIGPLEQGVYSLAVRPTGFDRWTWAFGADDPARATAIQVTAEAHTAPATIDLGIFEVECGPAIDLRPEIATGDDFPDLQEVEVEARILDLDVEKEIAERPRILRRDRRVLLRGLPRGEWRLELTLAHPHLLPEPALEWLLPIQLERGRLREIIPEVEALGGAIRVGGDRGALILTGPLPEPRYATFEDGRAELPSLPPGRYRLELHGEAEGDGPRRVWPAVEVRRGATTELELDEP